LISAKLNNSKNYHKSRQNFHNSSKDKKIKLSLKNFLSSSRETGKAGGDFQKRNDSGPLKDKLTIILVPTA
jgi:hypothetical protein